ncbi:fumarylacetoacetate hydrolase family protein [Amycolatopsis sp. TRM77291]
MKLATVRTGSGRAIGIVSDDAHTIRVLPASSGSVDDVVRGVGTVGAIARHAAAVEPVPVESVDLAPPLTRFNRDILCTGWNYLDHFYESAGKREGQDPDSMPSRPTFFTKGPQTVIGPNDPIAYDGRLSTKWDYEAEIAIVIGRDGRSIREVDAWNHVFGFLLANDVSQRDMQRAYGGQWLKGKSVDRTMPLGPWITTLDEIPRVDDLPIECELNGVTMQRATVGKMAFSIPRIVAELSWGMTLHAGDVVLTGTPSGIGNAREPAVFLREGDTLVTRSGPLGILCNPVVPAKLT